VFYRSHLQGLYLQCDDRAEGYSRYIERVLFRTLAPMSEGEVQLFKTQPRIYAAAGDSGAVFPRGQFQWLVKQCLRRLNRLVDKRRLRYPS